MNSAFKLHEYPAWLQPLVRLFVPEIAGVDKCRQTTSRMLRPLIEQRLKDMQSSGREFKAPDDMIQWLITHAPSNRVSDVAWHTTQHLVLNIAAMHTTSSQVPPFPPIYFLISDYSLALRHSFRSRSTSKLRPAIARGNGGTSS